MKLFLLMLLILPIRFYSQTIEEMQGHIRSYFTQFKSFGTAFVLKTTGSYGSSIRRGFFQSANGEVIYRLDGSGPLNLKVNKDGTLQFKKNQSDLKYIYNTLESLYYIIMTNDFKMSITGGDASNTRAGAVNAAGNIHFELNYNKEMNMIDSVSYSGPEKSSALSAKISYTNIGGIPVFQEIFAEGAAGKIYLYLEDTAFELNPAKTND